MQPGKEGQQGQIMKSTKKRNKEASLFIAGNHTLQRTISSRKKEIFKLTLILFLTLPSF